MVNIVLWDLDGTLLQNPNGDLTAEQANNMTDAELRHYDSESKLSFLMHDLIWDWDAPEGKPEEIWNFREHVHYVLTARPENVRERTLKQLKALGYENVRELIMYPGTKRGTEAEIISWKCSEIIKKQNSCLYRYCIYVDSDEDFLKKLSLELRKQSYEYSEYIGLLRMFPANQIMTKISLRTLHQFIEGDLQI